LFTYCCVHVHSKRKRLADPDGLSIKAVLDGLTKAGVFADDNAKRIKEVRFTQEQSSVEETIIEILEAT
jgi:Holliday junction resolvase RusA-like endonuclease